MTRWYTVGYWVLVEFYMVTSASISFECLGGMDEDGNTLPAWGHHAIWVPPYVDVVGERITYPVAEHWATPQDFNPLREMGWTVRVDAAELVPALCALAGCSSNTQGRRVKSFVTQWGPLWTCTEHSDCHYSREGAMQEPPCRWDHVEWIEDFTVKACQVKAALDAALLLKDGRAVPQDIWLKLFPVPALEAGARWDHDTTGTESWGRLPLPLQWRFLCNVVNCYITVVPGGFTLWLGWDTANKVLSTPTLIFSPGLGFIRMAWLQIAQRIAQIDRRYVCDGCGQTYERTMRRPRRGERNYCPTCGKDDGYRESKRRAWHTRTGI